MISAREIAQGVYGAWRLARVDKDGIRYFDNTPEAAVASFKAAVVVAPIHAVLIALQTDWSMVAVGGFAALLIHAIAFVVDWTAFPLAMYYVARLCRREQFYCRYLGAFNWAQVPQNTAFLAISLLIAMGLLPPSLGGLLILVTLIAIFVYKGYIARVGLETSPPATVGIVLLDLGLSALLSAVMANLLRGYGLLG